MTNKKLLFISRHSPYGSSLAKEALDAILAASAYDQDLSFLFMDDGVFQLLREQNTHDITQKSFSSMLAALSLYDVNNIYVHQESLDARQIISDDILLQDITILDNTAIQQLMSDQHQLLSF